MYIHEDTNEIISDTAIPWQELRGATVLVTGATGMIGSAIARALAAANEQWELGVRILALGRNEEKMRPLADEYGALCIKHDIIKPFLPDTIKGPVDYIFHCAAMTSSSEMVMNPVGVLSTSLTGTANILELAWQKQTKSVVYLSSMEVYGATDPTLPCVCENNLGYIDISKPRSVYPEGKRMCECMGSAWYAQYGVPVKTARLAQTFGAGTAPEDTRVFAQFARSVVAGEDIVLHTMGKSRGNYCYISDAIRALFLLLFKGENGEAYNVANPAASMCIGEMAQMVADRIANGRISVVIDIPADSEARGYAPDTTMRLGIEKIKKLGWQPRYGLEDMYRRMIADWGATLHT